MKVNLINHQPRFAKWMQEKEISLDRGGIVSGVAGSGKTIVMLYLLKKEEKTLVLAPKAMLDQWVDETNTKSYLRAVKWHDTTRKEELLNDPDISVIVTTHDTGANNQLLRQMSWHRIVVDEAHKSLINIGTVNAKGISSLNSRIKWVLTATPIVNCFSDLFHLAIYLKAPEAINAIKFQQSFHSFVDRQVLQMSKAEIEAMSLPPKLSEIVDIKLTNAEQLIYGQLVNQKAKHTFQKMQALRSFTSSPTVFMRKHGLAERLDGIDSKLKWIVNYFNDKCKPKGEKAIVFSYQVQVLQYYKEILQDSALQVYHGGLGTSARTRILQTFKEMEGSVILLASSKSLDAGVNITAANHVILCNPAWSFVHDLQSQARAHRIGQEKTVYVTTLRSSNTIEKYMDLVSERKQSLSQHLLL